MGCDIHMHVEYKYRLKDDNAHWMCGDYFKLNPFRDKYDNEEKYTLVGFHDDRNYDLFSILANVRNYGRNEYIDDPRGLPDDVTKEVKEYCDKWGIDGHSHSYFTLKELIDFQKTIKPLKQRGMVDKETQHALDNFGLIPTVWCQMTNEPGWEWREWKEENKVLEPLIEDLKRRANELGVIYDFMWDEDYEAAYNRSELIRIVFWFDN